MCQPANSPDLNVLDLGFFNSIQSLQQRRCARNIDSLISAVESALYDVCPASLVRNFAPLKEVMNCVLKDKGGNHFPIPDTKEQARMRAGEDFTTIYRPRNYIEEGERFPASNEVEYGRLSHPCTSSKNGTIFLNNVENANGTIFMKWR